MSKMTSHQVQVAAEAFAAGALAHAGFNVSVQYAANRPEYDLLVEKKERVLKMIKVLSCYAYKCEFHLRGSN